jgi:hypothetical protein
VLLLLLLLLLLVQLLLQLSHLSLVLRRRVLFLVLFENQPRLLAVSLLLGRKLPASCGGIEQRHCRFDGGQLTSLEQRPLRLIE